MDYYLPIKNKACRYCGKMFSYSASRGAHESRCPALKKIPNTVKLYRKTLLWVAERLATNEVTKREGKALAKMINNTLNKH